MNKLLIAMGVMALLFCGVGNVSATLTPAVDINDLVAGTPIISEQTTFIPLPEISFEPAEFIPLPEPSFTPFVAKLQTYYLISSSVTLSAYSMSPPIPFTAYEVDETPVPEPATMLLFGTGLAGLIGYRLRKNKKTSSSDRRGSF